MPFDFDALPDDAKRAFFAKVRPGKGSRTRSSGRDEKSRGNTKRKTEPPAGESRKNLAAGVWFAPNARTALQRFAEVLFREHEDESKSTAEVVRDLKQLKEIVERVMEFDRTVKRLDLKVRVPDPSPELLANLGLRPWEKDLILDPLAPGGAGKQRPSWKDLPSSFEPNKPVYWKLLEEQVKKQVEEPDSQLKRAAGKGMARLLNYLFSSDRYVLRDYPNPQEAEMYPWPLKAPKALIVEKLYPGFSERTTGPILPPARTKPLFGFHTPFGRFERYEMGTPEVTVKVDWNDLLRSMRDAGSTVADELWELRRRFR